MKKYLRASLEVEAAKYEQGKGMEDGYELFSKVVTNGWVVSEGLFVPLFKTGAVSFLSVRAIILFMSKAESVTSAARTNLQTVSV